MSTPEQAQKPTVIFLPDDATIPEIEQRVSSARLRKLFDMSRTTFDRLAASGALGDFITHNDGTKGKNAMRFYRVSSVKAYLETRDRDKEREHYAIKAKASAILRRIR